MLLRKILIAACCAAAFLLTGCSNSGSSGSVSSSALGNKSHTFSQTTQPVYGSDIVSQAKSLGSSPGRVALAMIICRLDGSYVYTDLVKQNADDLFDIVSECAVHKSITLEALNNQYGLTDILASEGINVTIKANNVMPHLTSSNTSDKTSQYSTSTSDSSKQSSSSNTKSEWMKKFESEIQKPPKA